LNYDPEKMKKKKPVTDWLSMMGRTKHLVKEEYQDVVSEIQKEIDRRFKILKIKNETPEL
jgi:pyruvate ferredoxin oxidoreductase alpha subunit